MAVVNATNYTSSGMLSNAGAAGIGFARQAGDREFSNLFRSGRRGDRYGLSGALSRMMPPLTAGITAPSGIGRTPLSSTVSRSAGPLDSFLRSSSSGAAASKAVYGPFTPSAATIRGGITAFSAARPSDRIPSTGISAYRRMASSAFAGVNLLA